MQCHRSRDCPPAAAAMASEDPGTGAGIVRRQRKTGSEKQFDSPPMIDQKPCAICRDDRLSHARMPGAVSSPTNDTAVSTARKQINSNVTNAGNTTDNEAPRPAVVTVRVGARRVMDILHTIRCVSIVRARDTQRRPPWSITSSHTRAT